MQKPIQQPVEEEEDNQVLDLSMKNTPKSRPDSGVSPAMMSSMMMGNFIGSGPPPPFCYVPISPVSSPSPRTTGAGDVIGNNNNNNARLVTVAGAGGQNPHHSSPGNTNTKSSPMTPLSGNISPSSSLLLQQDFKYDRWNINMFLYHVDKQIYRFKMPNVGLWWIGSRERQLFVAQECVGVSESRAAAQTQRRVWAAQMPSWRVRREWTYHRKVLVAQEVRFPLLNKFFRINEERKKEVGKEEIMRKVEKKV